MKKEVFPEDVFLAIFAYNRLDHITETLKKVIKIECKPAQIFVFIDGPKNLEDKNKIEKVKEAIIDMNSQSIFKIITKEKNEGLSKSIINGINYIFKNEKCEKVIVLEDDCKPDDDFFEYMKKSFKFYEQYNIDALNKVMHISGFGLPLDYHKQNLVEHQNYLNKYPCSWGWGTWKKYWNECDFNDQIAYRKILSSHKEIKKFNEDGSAFSDFLYKQQKGEVDSWLIRWYVHIYKSEGISSWKVKSSIDNSGFDGSGKHKVKFDRFNQSEKYKKKLNTNITSNEFSTALYTENLRKEFKKYFISHSDKFKINILSYFIIKKFKSLLDR